MRSDTSVLVVEDEADLADLICFNLQREGFQTKHAATGRQALRALRDSQPSAIVLDRMLPDISGDEVLAQARRGTTASTPILMLTAKAEESDQLVGFALGADDYMTKPFSIKVLVARIKALLRRRDLEAASPTRVFADGPFTLDVDRHQLTVHETPIELTATEFRLMRALMAARGRVLERSRLLDEVVGERAAVTDRTIDVHITALRKKIGKVEGDGAPQSWIQTVRGVGYTFRAPVGASN
jgi:two-component system phosphate regulon response regulator PhoB